MRRRKKTNAANEKTKRCETEYLNIWHWNDKTKRRVREVNHFTEAINQGLLINPIDRRVEPEILLDRFESKWSIGVHHKETSDYDARSRITAELIERPNWNAPLPKKQFFERGAAYKKRCDEFKYLSITPTKKKVDEA